MGKHKTLLHQFWGEPTYPGREAKVYIVREPSKFYREYFEVEFYDNSKLKETRIIKEHSEMYAEDCAENWVLGVIN